MSQGNLKLKACIGISGDVPAGFILHPDDEHIYYPLGSTVVVKHLTNHTQRFIQCGNTVSCLSINKAGTMLATGTSTHMGFAAETTVWDLATSQPLHTLKLHKGKVQCISFSAHDKYIATLGGPDDNKVVIWNLETGDAVCGYPAANDPAHCIVYHPFDDNVFVTAGEYNLRSWQFDLENRKIRPTDFKLGPLKRICYCAVFDESGEFVFCGTQSGDVLKVRMDSNLFVESGPTDKKKLGRGIRSIILDGHGNLLVGGGDGVVCRMTKDFKIKKSRKLEGMITSLALNKAQDHFFVGSSMSCTWLVALNDFDHELRSSAHFAPINDVCFPFGSTKLFVTASDDIRIWNTQNRTELLRIKVPNLTCNCVALQKDGKAIVSGWSDGKIRAFYPESGKIMYTINEAHSVDGVTAVAVTSDCTRIISGGKDGLVRVWRVSAQKQDMLASLKEHKHKVSSIFINADDATFCSAGHDGSTVVWDLQKLTRCNALFQSTQFESVVIHPDESQILTTGNDRKVQYWDAVEGVLVRTLEASESAVVHTLSISPDGTHFMSAGGDNLVRYWHYDEGLVKAIGHGHSGAVKQAAISPDGSEAVSVGDEGAIMIWDLASVDTHEAGATE